MYSYPFLLLCCPEYNHSINAITPPSMSSIKNFLHIFINPNSKSLVLLVYFELSTIVSAFQRLQHLEMVILTSCIPSIQMKKKSLLLFGCLAERLRRWTRNPLGNSRVGSNPAAVVNSTFCTQFVFLTVWAKTLIFPWIVSLVDYSTSAMYSLFSYNRKLVYLLCGYLTL